MYADDLVCYTGSHSICEIYETLEEALDSLYINLESLGLSLSCAKSRLCIFSKNKHKKIDNFILKYRYRLMHAGVEVPRVNSVWFLGVTLDRGLKWKAHFTDVAKQCQKRINFLKSLGTLSWSSHPATLLQVYKGWIRSVIEYGCQIFAEVDERIRIIIDRVQFQALRAVPSLMSTTPINVLLHVAGEIDLSTRFRMLINKYLVGICSMKGHPLVELLMEFGNFRGEHCSLLIDLFGSVYSSLNNNLFKYDLPCALNYGFYSRFDKFNVDLCSGIDCYVTNHPVNVGNGKSVPDCNSLCMKMLKKKNLFHSLILYTDGSMIPDVGTGCAVWSSRLDVELGIELSKYNSIFEAEALAILHALHVCEEKCAVSAVILSDSRSVLSAICTYDTWARQHILIYAIKDILYSMERNGRTIHLIWIPSHRGIFGNERADQLAKQAAQGIASLKHEVIFTSNISKIFNKDIIAEFTQGLLEQTAQKGWTYFNRVKEKARIVQPWYENYPRLHRECITFISRLRTGHVAVADHFYKKGMKDSPVCACGAPNETLGHSF